jgi:hypothetical protein
MRAFAPFAVALFVSMLVAQFVAHQLAIQFRTRDEIVLVMVVLGGFAVVSIAVLLIAFRGSEDMRALNVGATIAAAVAILPVLGLLLYEMARNDWTRPSSYDMQICAEILLPALVAVAIQWWLIRRHRRGNLN